MPFYSAFTPYGMLRYSGATSTAERMYDQIVALQGGAFSTVQGTDEEAETYAKAMMLARVSDTLDRVVSNKSPSTAFELLPQLEADRKALPPPVGTTLDQRRALQVARQKRIAGGTATDIASALGDLLGSDFIAYRPIKSTERTLTPVDPTTSGIFSRVDIAPTIIRLTNAVAFTGVPITVRYTMFRASDPFVAFPVGTKLVIDAGNKSQREVITTSGAVQGVGFVATFGMSHEPGTVCTTGPFPAWSSTKRHSLIVVSQAASLSSVQRQAISELMKRYARAVSTWSIVRELTAGSGTVGPFTIGVSPIGIDPIGTVTL